MSSVDLTQLKIERWKSEGAATGSISHVLRKISAHYGINKFEVASMAADIFEESFTGEDMQVLWKWNTGNSPGGFEDYEVDALLGHLLR